MKMRPYTVYFPKAMIELLDTLVQRKLYPNRAEAIRAAVRDLILSHIGEGDVA